MKPEQANRSETLTRDQTLIYVVDDEAMLLELAVVILEPLGYRLRTFRDPALALEAFSSEPSPPALIVTDYAMQSMSGLQLMESCRRLRPGQKVLMISGTVDEKFFRNTGSQPDVFLAKPYHAKQLVDLVKTLVAD